MTNAGDTADFLVSSLHGLQTDAVAGPVVTQLLAAISAEPAPAPLLSVEALARLRFANVDVDTLLSKLDTVMTSECGQPIFGQAALTSFAAVGPKPDPPGVDAPTADYGACPDERPLGYIAPFRFVALCSTRQVATVDLKTGALTLSSIQQPTGPFLGVDTVALGDRFAWIDAVTVPAVGLTPSSWIVYLRIRGYDGSVIADVPITPPGNPDDGQATVVAVGAQRMLTLTKTHAEAEQLVLRDQSGTQIKVFDQGLTHDASFSLLQGASRTSGPEILVGPVAGFVFLEYVGDAFDATTGAPVAPGQNILSDGCQQTTMFYAPAAPGAGPAKGVLATATGNGTGVNLSALAPGVGAAITGASQIVGATGPGFVYIDGGSHDLKLVHWDGTAGWSIPSTVVHSARVIRGWVQVYTNSNTDALVDPRTGQEEVGLDQALVTAIEYDNLDLRTTTTVLGANVVLSDPDGESPAKHAYLGPIAQMCG